MGSSKTSSASGNGESLLERLNHFSDQLARARDQQALVQVALTGIFGLLPVALVELNLIEPNSGQIIPHRQTTPALGAYFQQHPLGHYHLGQGLTGWLIEHGTPLHIPDLQQVGADLPRPAFSDLPLRAYLGAPLNIGGEIIGTLEIAQATDAAQALDRALFDLLTRLVSAALKSCRLEHENSQHQRLWGAIDVLRRIRLRGEGDAATDPAVLSRLADQLQADLLAIFQLDPENGKLELQQPAYGEKLLVLADLGLSAGASSPLGSVLRTHTHWISNHIYEDASFAELGLALDYNDFPLAHVLFAPLGPPGKPRGMLLLARTAERPPFDEHEAELLLSLLPAFADLAPGPSPDHEERAAAQPVRREPESVLQRTDSLLRLATQISTSLDLERVLTQSLAVLVDITPAQRGLMLLYNADLNRFSLRASFGEGPAMPPGGLALEHGASQGLGGWALANRQAFVVGDLQAEPRWIPIDEDARRYRSAAVAPLIANDEVLGAAILLALQPAAFGEEELRALATAAGQVAVAIKNAELYLLIRDQAERMGAMLRSQQVDASTSRAILESIADGVIVTDAEHRVVLFNAAAERMLGLQAEAILNQPVFDFVGLYGPEGQNWARAIRSWKKNPPQPVFADDVSERVVLEDDRVLLIHPAPVVLGDEFLGTVSIFRDITREVEVDRLKSEFVATVSHELRTPMTSIKGFVDLLLMGATGPLNPEQIRFLEIVKNNTERLEILVNDLLDISRIEAGKVTLSFQPIDVHGLLREGELFVERLRLETGKQIELVLEAPGELPHLWGDPERVRQILNNLIENAFNYTPEGGRITLHAGQAQDRIEIEVSDNGIGISLSEQARIFERFYRGEQALIMGVAGTGLGLAIVLNLVEMHNGRIWVNSDGIPGRGTTFTLALPLARETSLTPAQQDRE